MRGTGAVSLRLCACARIRIWRDYPPSVVPSSVINSVKSAGPEMSLKLGSLFKGENGERCGRHGSSVRFVPDTIRSDSVGHVRTIFLPRVRRAETPLVLSAPSSGTPRDREGAEGSAARAREVQGESAAGKTNEPDFSFRLTRSTRPALKRPIN